MGKRRLARAMAALLAVGATLALAGCGGGGSAVVRPAPPPPSQPPSPVTYTTHDAQLVPTGVQAAQQAGFTGAGVKIGDLDTGVDPNDPTFGAGDASGRDKIAWFKSYLPGTSDPSAVNDNAGHGTQVVELIVGDPYTGVGRCRYTGDPCATDTYEFDGGVAPGANVYEAQICANEDGGKNEGCTPTLQAYQDLIAQGVKVINQEFGDALVSQEITNVSPTDPGVVAYHAMHVAAANAGVLLIAGTGDNGEMTSPGRAAGLPYLFPQYQPYTIAVTGLAMGADGKPTGRDTSDTNGSTEGGATPCGVTAAWCLGAPFGVYTIPTDSYWTEPAYGVSWGQAMVTGITALVWQAYPWMSAPNVQDTLLTTATPVPGCAPKDCGWGMVNAAKAIHGPGQFAFPQFGPFSAAIPTGVTSTFSNDIGGSGGLLLTGPGTLVLTGTDTYAGGSEILAGTLTVNGSVASKVTVDATSGIHPLASGGTATVGTLDGTGTVNADVVNGGVVRSAGSAATQGLTITGNLTDEPGSTTAVALGDPLTVVGTANLAGAMQVLAPPANYTVKATEPLVNAGSVSGTFASLGFASGVFYTGTLGYSATQVNVTLTQNNIHSTAVHMAPFAQLQAVHAAANVQAALDASNAFVASGHATGHAAWLRAAGTFLAAANVPEAVASLDSLSGEIHATSRAVEVQQALATDAAVANRGHALAVDGQAGLWVQALGADGALARRGYDAADYRAGGMLVGFDGPLTRAWAAGVAGGRARIWTGMTGLGGHVDAREDVLAGYVCWQGRGGTYAAARVSRASIDSTVRRSLLLGATFTGSSAARTDHVTMLAVEGGSALAFGRTTLTPYVALSALRLEQAAFTERGSAMGLAAPAQSHTATFGTFGLRWGRDFDWALGHMHLDGYVAARRVLGGADLGMRASFAGLPRVMFTAQGQDLPRNAAVFGLHMDSAVTRAWGWFMDADWQAGSEGLHQAEADAGIRIRV